MTILVYAATSSQVSFNTAWLGSITTQSSGACAVVVRSANGAPHVMVGVYPVYEDALAAAERLGTTLGESVYDAAVESALGYPFGPS
ncbi:hypothetical protein [Agrobacterium vitis]|uniref:hypothetical protein n=1 Tax=Agrobacterium vitis TaxID=373 RepID=UPI0015748DB6|nr:hypothetical protein [Agrobacterium vitis]NSZ19327.1 hypothetical protein [Agrobacterium vitis]QZO06195.1 hypothetical protein K4831_21340 [Agrobacterium vitis]UJL90518.1 hypothetical protein AVF2S5_21375 [Agrobacterium vitis]